LSVPGKAPTGTGPAVWAIRDGEAVKILVAGNLSCLAATLAKPLTNGKMKVVIAGPGSKDLQPTIATAYPVPLTDRSFRELVSTFKFDAVIYLATREEQLLAVGLLSAAQVLDGIQNALESCKAARVGRFVLISSTEVYGGQEDTGESSTVQPTSPNGCLLAAAEQSYRYYSDQFGLNATVVRVPFLYGHDEKGGLVSGVLEDRRAQNRVMLPAAEGAVFNLLSAVEVAGRTATTMAGHQPIFCAPRFGRAVGNAPRTAVPRPAGYFPFSRPLAFRTRNSTTIGCL
jgi:nucleoside-diphosphate-sugar epimerase